MLSLIFFIAMVIVTIICAIAVIRNRVVKLNRDRFGDIDGVALGFQVAPIVVGAITTLMIIMMVTTVVPARTVGINLAFGKPIRTLDNGLHVIAPWSTVEKLDLAVQNDIYNGDNAVDVRLANSAKARVDASIQWQLKPEGAESTFMDYRSFESIQSNLVDRNFRAALNEAMGSFDPLAAVKDGGQEKALGAFAKDVEKRMTEKVGDRIEVRSVTIPIVNFDEATQARINELQTEFARTRIAEQKKATSKAEAEANRELQQSVTAETLTDKCLNIVRETNQSPLGCFPNSNVTPITQAK